MPPPPPSPPPATATPTATTTNPSRQTNTIVLSEYLRGERPLPFPCAAVRFATYILGAWQVPFTFTYLNGRTALYVGDAASTVGDLKRELHPLVGVLEKIAPGKATLLGDNVLLTEAGELVVIPPLEGAAPKRGRKRDTDWHRKAGAKRISSGPAFAPACSDDDNSDGEEGDDDSPSDGDATDAEDEPAGCHEAAEAAAGSCDAPREPAPAPKADGEQLTIASIAARPSRRSPKSCHSCAEAGSLSKASASALRCASRPSSYASDCHRPPATLTPLSSTPGERCRDANLAIHGRAIHGRASPHPRVTPARASRHPSPSVDNPLTSRPAVTRARDPSTRSPAQRQSSPPRVETSGRAASIAACCAAAVCGAGSGGSGQR